MSKRNNYKYITIKEEDAEVLCKFLKDYVLMTYYNLYHESDTPLLSMTADNVFETTSALVCLQFRLAKEKCRKLSKTDINLLYTTLCNGLTKVLAIRPKSLTITQMYTLTTIWKRCQEFLAKIALDDAIIYETEPIAPTL